MDKLNITPLCEALLVEFIRLHPAIKDEKAIKYMSEYADVVVAELTECMKFNNNKEGEYQFRSRTVTHALGQIQIANRRRWAFNYYNTFGSLRLVRTVMTGHQGTNGRVCLEDKYKDLIMNEIGNTLITGAINTLSSTVVQTTINDATDYIKVNEQSLMDFINSTKQELELTNKSQYYKEKLIRNLKNARELQTLIVQRDGHACLPEVYETADSGRRYGSGKSLQCQPKEVRHAALGPCYHYDFAVNSFATLLSLAKAEAEDQGIKLYSGALEDFISNREKVRERFAIAAGYVKANGEATDQGISVIKKVFTSLSFDAKATDNIHKGIRKCFYDQESYERLMNNKTFKFIYEEIQAINDIIDNSSMFPNVEWTYLLDGVSYKPVDSDGKKRNRAQKLAWIYQHIETYLMNVFLEIVKKYHDMDPLLVVHDGVYFARPIPNDTLQDVHYTLRTVNGFKYVKIEETKIFPICTNETFHQRGQEIDQDIQAHKTLIASQERQAQGYERDLPFNHDDVVVDTNNSHPLIAQQQYIEYRHNELYRNAQEYDYDEEEDDTDE